MGGESAALSVEEILSGYRDLGGPRPPAGTVFLSCDPAFNRYTRFWIKGPTLDATHGALETMLLLHKDPLRLAAGERQLYALLARQFIQETGMFATNGRDLSGGIYGLHNAIGLIKTMNHLHARERLGLTRYRSAIKKIGQEPALALERMTEFLRECVSDDHDGGLLDHPDVTPRRSSVTTVHTAISTLWNLYGKNAYKHLDRILPLSHIAKFLRRCLRQTKVGKVPVAAFTIHPDVNELCANTTYFATETIRHLGLDHLLTGEVKSRIANFLTRISWRYREGGFSSTIGEVPSLNATFFALKALLSLSRPTFLALVRQNHAKIYSFVDSCGREGGYAFTNHFDRYLPNALATRYAVQILELLQNQKSTVPPQSDVATRRILGFLRSELWDKRSGAFQGYPGFRIRGANNFSSHALYQWDAGKQHRHASEADKLFALLADGLQKVWELDLESMGSTSLQPVKVRGGKVVMRRVKAESRPSQRKYSLWEGPQGEFSLIEISPPVTEPTSIAPEAAP